MNLLQILRSSINAIYAKYLKNEDIDNLPIYYIGGSQTLPPPLSPEEEEETLQKIAAGQEELRQVLVERNLRLVVYIAKKFENTGIGIEDLISIGTIGLMKAINTFNVNKNIKLATYASRCIENEILMYLRRSNKIKGEISIFMFLIISYQLSLISECHHINILILFLIVKSINDIMAFIYCKPVHYLLYSIP